MPANISGNFPLHPSAQLQVVLRVFDIICAPEIDINALAELIAPEFECRIAPNSVKKPVAKRDAWLEFIEGIRTRLFTTLKVSIHQLHFHEIIEGQGSVILHGSSDGVSVTGQPYKNEYIFILHLKDDGGRYLLTQGMG
ncbi:hypothetical protein K474DRAFT_1670714 [Panus rudis PR-1116 ss-1]|nr:hypothetical protein K474DRAFT_1670714 [Panus rudis PR-1116 ss-1]